MLQQKGKKNCAGEAIPNRTQINVEVTNVVFVSVLHKIHGIIIPVSCGCDGAGGSLQSDHLSSQDVCFKCQVDSGNSTVDTALATSTRKLHSSSF